ncbi:MAG: hypothetical protein WEA58_02845 [Balneolaceae bacterium]
MAGTTTTHSPYKQYNHLQRNPGRLARAYTFLITVLLLISAVSIEDSEAQSRAYEFLPAPDLWYNDVDGIRVGVRVKGQMRGTFDDGPHRLDGGLWLSTWFPSTPVSYYLKYTNPIPRWSDYGNEANYQVTSSIRTGYHIHGVGLNKRWQEGFDERKYREIGITTNFEKRFDDEYVQFPVLWSDQSKILTKLTYESQSENRFGWANLAASGSVQYLDDTYGIFEATATQRVPLNENWGFRFRSFLGIASSQTAPEYLFSRSSAPAISWMDNGMTRAKGTIPQPWMTSGNVQVAGGANLRGYTDRDVNSYQNASTNSFLYNSIAAVNAEFDYPNPINSLFNAIPYASEFLTFNSYLFYDAGTSLGIVDNEIDGVLADAGAGFSLTLNIPDYLGKPRGFVFRYDIPFWLSEPGTEDAFKFRSLFAFGAIISL